MKRLSLSIALAVALAACNGGNKKTESAENNDVNTSESADLPVFELDDLLPVADRQLDKTIKVVGYVTHTCKHAGKRCFIVGETQQASMRVEAKGNIGGFNRELVGSKLEIIGILKERRLTKEYISQMEQNVELKKQEDGAAESCAAELSNINDMRKWMKAHNKDYYSIFYMDGLDYAALESE
ncbi:MAG: hypothetical protein LBF79_03090 [Dysgonamonadaceae bacterium]|jgi:hypothetical protein|nr:hypothetical protein [Dysgonamonadaceae bacterium]